MIWCAFLLLFTVVTTEAVRRPPLNEDLRALIRFPTIDPPLEIKLEPGGGFAFFEEVPEPGKQIEDLRKTLQNSADDAEKQVRIARFYGLSGDQIKRRAALEKAHLWFQQRLDRQQGDAALMTSDGEVLRMLGRSREAEARLREATQLAPDDWECWLGLARFCKSAAFEQVAGFPLERADTAFLPILQQSLDRHPSPARLDRASDYLREGEQAFDRCLAAVPRKEPENISEVRTERGLFLALRNALTLGLEQVRGGVVEFGKLRAALYRGNVLEEFRSASTLSPESSPAFGALAVVEAAASLYQGEDSDRNPRLTAEPWTFLLPEARQRLQALLLHLDVLGEGNDPAKAASALWTMAILQQGLLGDLKGAENSLRKAVAHKPGSDRAFALFCAVLAARENFAELQSICEERLRSGSALLARLYIAKALAKAGEYEEAAAHLQLGLQAQPNDFLGNLAFASVTMQREDWEWHSSQVQDALSKAARTLGASAPRDKWIELALTESIFFGLQDNPDAARRILKAVLNISRDDPRAKAILGLIGY